MISQGTKLLVVGDYPPPYGGVSVQVSVLRRLLSEIPGFTCRVLDIGAARRLKRPECLPVRNPLDLVWNLLSHAARQYTIHLHTNGHNLKSWLVSLACAAAGIFNGRKTVLSIGSGAAPEFIRTADWSTHILIRVTLALTGAIITRNQRTRRTIVDLGIPARKIAVLSGFYGVSTKEVGVIPGRIEDFLRRHSPILGAMASAGPEYGISLIVEAASHLRSLNPRLGLLLIGPEGVQNHGLDGDLLVTGELPHGVVLEVMQKVSVFARPTYFDGDASSVREALALGVPVVASDTDFRPEGVILFRRGDVKDLTLKIARLLHNGHAKDTRLQPAKSGSLEQLLAIYEALRTHRWFMEAFR